MSFLKTMLLVGCLLVFGSSIVSASGSMDEVLLNAVGNNNMELAQTAIANGANVNCVLQDCYTPLVLAVKNKSVAMVGYLLAHGANPNQKKSEFSWWDTPLIVAVDSDNLQIAQMLVQAGANVNTPREMKKGGIDHYPADGDGATPLIFAIQKEWIDDPSFPMVQFLVSKGADVNQANDHGYTPLMAAAKYKWGNQQQNRCQIAKVLLAAGANPAKKDSDGKMALQYALGTNFTDMINLLLPISPK